MITTTLASFPSPSQGVWHISLWNVHIPIRAYALFIIIGIIAALLIGDRRWAARGGEKGVIYDIALWAVPFGLVGGRLYHVLTDWPTYFGAGGAGPLAAFRVWDGGLGIWGAVALGGVGAWIGCRRRGIPLPAFGDAIAPGIVLAQAIGRVGNYFNQELYGRETTLPWGMEIFYRQDPSGIVDVHSLNGVSTGQLYAVVHPTFLYELLWNLLVFVILILVDRRYKIGHGRLFALYVALYCVGRFCVELLRDDNATHIAGIRINSFTSTFVFLGAVVYIVLAKKGREDPRTLGGHQEESEAPAKVPVFAKEFAAVASGTGVVAAATVAGREDTDYDVDPETLDVLETAEEVESVDEFEPLDESQVVDETEAVDDPGTAESEPTGSPEADTEADIAEPEDLTADVVLAESDAGEPIESESVVVGDADDVEGETEDEAIIEAEVASPAVAVESVVDAEEELIDEDHDPIDEDELEGLLEGDVTSGPLSEQEESLENEQDAPEPEVAVVSELAEAEVAVEPVVSELAEAGRLPSSPACLGWRRRRVRSSRSCLSWRRRRLRSSPACLSWRRRRSPSSPACRGWRRRRLRSSPACRGWRRRRSRSSPACLSWRSRRSPSSPACLGWRSRRSPSSPACLGWRSRRLRSSLTCLGWRSRRSRSSLTCRSWRSPS